MDDAQAQRVADPEWLVAVGLIGQRLEAGRLSGRHYGVGWDVTEEEARAESQAATESLVYFVQQDGGSYAVKIGLSSPRRLRTRLGGLVGGSPYPLVLLRIFPGGPKLERYLHRVFDDYRMNGEWFEAAPRLIEAVGRGHVYTLDRSMEYIGPGADRLAEPLRITPEMVEEEVALQVRRSNAIERIASRAA